MDMHWTFGFEPDGAQTRLTAVADLKPSGSCASRRRCSHP
jgi:hypothetical protein